jgi:IS30 family transposase
MEGEAQYTKGSGFKLSEFDRGYMKAMHELGKDALEISAHMNVARSTVYRLISLGFQYA